MSAKGLMRLYNGLKRAYGTYRLYEEHEGVKVTGKAVTEWKTPGQQQWEDHLSGKLGIGIIPIREDNTCFFGAIDIDVYDLDLEDLEATVRKLGLPLVLCRTKSGGAHLYLFMSEPCPAYKVRACLTQWAIVLGYAGVEIFPKQDALAGEEDAGNWINMPYFDDAQGTMRYAIINGKGVELDAFIEYAKQKRIKEENLIPIDLPEDMKGMPPCLQAITMRGAPEGSRNVLLFNFGVFAKLSDEYNWENKLSTMNQAYIDPPLTHSEMGTIIKSVGKKKYFYQCKQAILAANCDKALCKKCEFGIGIETTDPGVDFEGLTKITSEPPVWIIQIAGKRMRMETAELTSQLRFAQRCVESLNYYPTQLKPHRWRELINTLLGDVREIEAPPDAGVKGQFLFHLEQFCVTKAMANKREEMILGKPWHNDGRTYFQVSQLLKYLDQQKFKDYKAHDIYAILKEDLEAEQHFFNLCNRGTNCWSVESFNKQTEDFEVPRTEEQEEF